MGYFAFKSFILNDSDDTKMKNRLLHPMNLFSEYK